MDGLFTRTWADARAYAPQALGLHLLMQVMGAALLTPLVVLIGHLFVRVSGGPVVTNYDIAAFLLSPLGATLLLIFVALVISLLLTEFLGQSWIAGHAIARRPVTLASTLALLARKLPWLVLLSARGIVRLILLSLPWLAIIGATWFFTLRGHDINYYLSEEPPEWVRARLIAAVAGLGLALVVAWQLARWLFALPILDFEQGSPRQALAKSTEMTRGHLMRIVILLVAWWCAVALGSILLVRAAHPLAAAGMSWAGVAMGRVLPLLSIYLLVSLVFGFIISALHVVGHQFLVTRLYAEARDAARWKVAAEPREAEPVARRRLVTVIAGAPVLLLIAMAITWLLAARLELHPEVAVTAHRGASIAAPENTMAAFRRAVEAGADYIELDVQHTRDGQVVVLHDGDLMRMGGDPRKIGELTMAELDSIDIGRRYGPAFAGEHVPALEEVIDLARGHLKINIELKYNVPDSTLAPAVIDLLRRKDFMDQVVITSLDYGAIRQVERIEPSLRTGLIVTASVGNVLKTEADFLSLNAARATPKLIRQAHRAGKDVHVWTVNDPAAMLRMVERGVDNVITDDPVTMMRILSQRAALSPREQLALRLRVLFDEPPKEAEDPSAVRVL